MATPCREVKRIGRLSPGLMARLGVPVGGRVRKLRVVKGNFGHSLAEGVEIKIPSSMTCLFFLTVDS